MVLHGLRMSIGALIQFYPYRWKEDIPRYRFAKERFTKGDGMPESQWWIKVQHDTLQQAYANACPLCLPVMLACHNKTETLNVFEIIGVVLWFSCWIVENIADIQKLAFMQATKEEGVKDAVLGCAPYDTKAYRCWTLCRHPNYFGEWMSWVSFIIMGVPSLIDYKDELWIKISFGVTLFLLMRFFYDCLNYWTGAEPAEYFSVKKREKYKEYQRTTRCFWPIQVPFIDHAMVEGWPYPNGLGSENDQELTEEQEKS